MGRRSTASSSDAARKVVPARRACVGARRGRRAGRADGRAAGLVRGPWPPGRRHRVFVFDRGFAVVTGRRATEHAWSELALIYVGSHRTERFAGENKYHGRWETADGLRLAFRAREQSSRTLARDYVRSRTIWGQSPRRAGPLMSAVWERVVPIQLPALRDALARGRGGPLRPGSALATGPARRGTGVPARGDQTGFARARALSPPATARGAPGCRQVRQQAPRGARARRRRAQQPDAGHLVVEHVIESVATVNRGLSGRPG